MSTTAVQPEISELLLNDSLAPACFILDHDHSLIYFNTNFKLFSEDSLDVIPQKGRKFLECLLDFSFKDYLEPNLLKALDGERVSSDFKLDNQNYQFSFHPLLDGGEIIGAVTSFVKDPKTDGHDDLSLLGDLERISDLGLYEYDLQKDEWTSSPHLSM